MGSVTAGAGASPHFFANTDSKKNAGLTPTPGVTDRTLSWFTYPLTYYRNAIIGIWQAGNAARVEIVDYH